MAIFPPGRLLMGCGTSAPVQGGAPLGAQVSLPEFKQWYVKLLVKEATKAAKVRRGPRSARRVCRACD